MKPRGQTKNNIVLVKLINEINDNLKAVITATKIQAPNLFDPTPNKNASRSDPQSAIVPQAKAHTFNKLKQILALAGARFRSHRYGH